MENKVYARDVAEALELFAPRGLQEGYDNCGLIIGDMDTVVTGVMLCTDVTEAVVREATETGCNMIVSHHPLIFRGMRRIDRSTPQGRCVVAAIKNDMAVYAGHTSFDNAPGGVSYRMAEKLSLKRVRVLREKEAMAAKLTVFVPRSHEEAVRSALAEAGAGATGRYDSCSFTAEGAGRFRPLAGARPFAGREGELHAERECRIEVTVPKYGIGAAVEAMLRSHPYEMPAYDITPLMNGLPDTGLGCIGELEEPVGEMEFLAEVRRVFGTEAIRHSALRGREVRKVAVCGGSGPDLIGDAIRAGADMYLTADISYHSFTEGEGRTVIADIGHFESEQFTKEIFREQLTEKFPNFAIRTAASDSNPVRCCRD